MIERTVDTLQYNAQGEEHARRQYKVALEVWNLNVFWKN